MTNIRDRAREQADGLDHWAAVLEVHEPKSSAAGIVMLREAAKTLRELATDAPEGPTRSLVDAAKVHMHALESLVDGYRADVNWGHIDVLRDAVQNSRYEWIDTLDRLDAQQKTEG